MDTEYHHAWVNGGFMSAYYKPWTPSFVTQPPLHMSYYELLFLPVCASGTLTQRVAFAGCLRQLYKLSLSCLPVLRLLAAPLCR